MAVQNPSGLKRYNLGTSHRRHISKAAASGHKKGVVEESFADPEVRGYIIQNISRIVQCELKAMCSMRVHSILRSKTNEALKSFKWDTYIKEIQANAPVLYQILLVSTKTRRPRINQIAVIGICTAILLKFWCGKMNLVHKIIGLILYAGHSGKQVISNNCFT